MGWRLLSLLFALTLLLLPCVAFAAGTADDLVRDEPGSADVLAPLSHARTAWNPDSIVFGFVTPDGAKIDLELTLGSGDPRADARLKRYDVRVAVEPADARGRLEPEIRRLVARIEARQDRGPELAPPRASAQLPSIVTVLAVQWLCVAVALSLLALRRLLAGRFTDGPARELASPPGPAWRAADVAAIVLVVGVALALRGVGLESPLLRGEEGITMSAPALSGWVGDYEARLHPPLFGQLVRWVLQLTHSLAAARGLSVLAGSVTVALAFVLGRRRGGLVGGVLAGALLAVAPAAIQLSRMVRGYALLGLVVLVVHALLSRALRRRDQRSWDLYALSVGVAVLTEYLALVPIAVDAAVCLLLARSQPATRVRLVLSALAGVALVGYVIPISLPTLHIGLEPTRGLPPTGWSGALVDLQDVVLGTLLPPTLAGTLVPLLVLALLPLGMTLGAHVAEGARLGASVLAIAGVYVVAALFTPVGDRFVVHALPLLAVLAGGVAPRVRWRFGAVIATCWLAAQAQALPEFYRRQLRGDDADRLLQTLRAAPADAPVALWPSARAADRLWRLTGRLHGPNPEMCPNACERIDDRWYYGIDSDAELSRFLAQHDAAYLLVDDGPLAPSQCRELDAQANTVLYRCEARATPAR